MFSIAHSLSFDRAAQWQKRCSTVSFHSTLKISHLSVLDRILQWHVCFLLVIRNVGWFILNRDCILCKEISGQICFDTLNHFYLYHLDLPFILKSSNDLVKW